MLNFWMILMMRCVVVDGGGVVIRWWCDDNDVVYDCCFWIFFCIFKNVDEDCVRDDQEEIKEEDE